MTTHFNLEKNNEEIILIAKEIAEEMLARLEFFTIKPKKIIYFDHQTETPNNLLKKNYPDAEIIFADQKIMPLPFAHQSVDLIFANGLMFSLPQLEKFFIECHRVLREEGLVFFSSLGPDTLREINLSLSYLIDMHDVGDALVHSHLADPVLDVEYFTVTYEEEEKFLHELRQKMMITEEHHLSQCVLEKKSLTYEIVYGHAWRVAQNPSADEEGVVKIPLSHLRGRLR